MNCYKQSIILMGVIFLISGCSVADTSTNNSKMTQNETVSSQESKTDTKNMDEVTELGQSEVSTNNDGNTTDSNQFGLLETKKKPHSSLNYNCDIEKDREHFDESNIDIVVGDEYYSTQINDWYMNFEEYEGKTVEIEGYYIADYLPYLFVGRYGPTCPYCQGGYVCFEFYTKEDLTQLVSGQDWIKVKGILRQDEDESGQFYYIETMSVEKMEEVGLDTVTN
ncbi:hypothetical protein [Candidatus Galacturonibacter soehngenii]|uniref:DUF1980 domain-containing protein n=1 Tax=Candidatus Galacturonatibacter soehngenii TaxID=2307010 RepID=A0A7V7QMH5_9FIRM|nr:hypothetical protein [Candidatus Galacturonibacter soehngenii]KAB1439869.1 hypothetical protein F7O84_05660 [Candidatus Galacturonibacter soehngenii]MBA4685893.1 hypothetical protein [Candidatus Galacturonibacter soehngenii]